MKKAFLSVLLAIMPFVLIAQDYSTTSIVTLLNGETIKGQVQKNRDGTFTITEPNGMVSYYSSMDVKSVVPVGPVIKKPSQSVNKSGKALYEKYTGLTSFVETAFGTNFHNPIWQPIAFGIGNNISPNTMIAGKLMAPGMNMFEASLKRYRNQEYYETYKYYAKNLVFVPAVEIRHALRDEYLSPYLGASVGLCFNIYTDLGLSFIWAYDDSGSEHHVDKEDILKEKSTTLGKYYLMSQSSPKVVTLYCEASAGMRIRNPHPENNDPIWGLPFTGWIGLSLSNLAGRASLLLKGGISF